MIRVKDKFIFLCTPSTGSRSVARVLLDQCGGEQLSLSHHATREEIQSVESAEPFYTFLRDPYDFVLSRYWHRTRGQKNRAWPFNFFLDDFFLNLNFDRFGMTIYPYKEYADQFFLYEDGLPAFFSAVGFPDVNIPHIGLHKPIQDHPRYRKDRMPRDQIARISSVLWEDIELYEQVAAQKE